MGGRLRGSSDHSGVAACNCFLALWAPPWPGTCRPWSGLLLPFLSLWGLRPRAWGIGLFIINSWMSVTGPPALSVTRGCWGR